MITKTKLIKTSITSHGCPSRAIMISESISSVQWGVTTCSHSAVREASRTQSSETEGLFPSRDSRVPHFTTSPEFPVTGPFLLPPQP